MAKNGKKGFIQEFKEFAISGNLFDMAVGVMIGGMFKGLVDAFTKSIITPIVGIFTGGIDLKSLRIELPMLFHKAVESAEGIEATEETAEAAAAGNYLEIGTFISEVISFLILMLVVFLMVKGVNKLRKAAEARKKKEPEEEPAPPEPTAEEKLLTEIRDLLADK